MSFYFSLNVASVTTAISFAATDFASINNYSNGLLYAFFAFSCLFIGKPMIAQLGSKTSMAVGLMGYCVYLLGYVAGEFAGPMANSCVLFGASVGGIGAGISWVSQGSYFSASSKLYARAGTHTCSQSPY
jgi:hypothetical protein